MALVTPEEIKRQSIKFTQYCRQYDEIYNNALEIAFEFEEEPPQQKTDEDLYEDFSSGKPCSV